VTAVFAAVVLAGMFLSSKHVKAIDDDSDSNDQGLNADSTLRLFL